MKKFEPRYRLVRYGMATKVEKASRQQRTFSLADVVVVVVVVFLLWDGSHGCGWLQGCRERWNEHGEHVQRERESDKERTSMLTLGQTGKQRKNRMKTFRGTAKTKGAKKEKK